MQRTLIGLTIVTLGEVAGLVIWLDLVTADRPYAGFAALVAGEALEWALLAYMIVKSPLSHPLKTGRTNAALVQSAVVSLAEAALWVGWLYLIPRIGFAVATIVLFVAMHIRHDLELSIFTGRTPLRSILAASDVTASAFEVGGAAAWFLLAMSGHVVLGALTLLVCITIEHTLQFWTAGFFKPENSP